jgi:hypothetical protein
MGVQLESISRANIEFAHVVAAFFFCTGIATLAFPYRFQAAALQKCQKFWGFPNPFLPFIGTQAYIWMIRVIGVVSIAAAALIEAIIFSVP